MKSTKWSHCPLSTLEPGMADIALCKDNDVKIKMLKICENTASVLRKILHPEESGHILELFLAL